MKRSCLDYRDLFRLPVIVFLGAVLFSSCDTYNFSRPQPADKQNIYQFPETMQGIWIDDDSELVLINKNYIGMVITENVNIVKGIWPKQNDKGDYTYLSSFYKSLYNITFDSLQKPVDTVKNYLVNGNNIYEITDKGLLGKGYPYQLKEDTFSVVRKDTMVVDLGHNAFLRDIGNGFFTLNILNQVLGQEKRWWQLFVMEKKENDKINIWYCAFRLTKLPSMFYEKHNNYYFNSEWTAAEMTKLIKQGSFEMCNQLRRTSR